MLSSGSSATAGPTSAGLDASAPRHHPACAVQTIETPQQLNDWRSDGPSVFVATMGALHDGHTALIKLARARAERTGERVIVSVFVNPAQFNQRSDLENYPRPIERDAAVCRDLGVDGFWLPGVEDIYPDGLPASPTRELPEIARAPGLEDRFRPGHLEGVWLVLERFFELLSPAAAVFGEKDWQQLQLARVLARSFSPEIEILGGETVRDQRGLALSSRNEHLDAEQLARASAIGSALQEAALAPTPGRAEVMLGETLAATGFDVEYAVARDASDLLETREGRDVRLLTACVVDGIRLIDNHPWTGARNAPSR